jgi:phosphoribosylaminoimidazole-succinocarboxamide synthase
MQTSIRETNFRLPHQTNFYRGKVRDVYTIDDRYLVIIATDRISAFDVVLPRAIPYKGQVLNQIAETFLRATQNLVPNYLLNVPDPNVSIGLKCEPIRIEMVIRGYLCGHSWREYSEGKRMICGEPMPEGMRENDPFPQPIITPSTKAEAGHDLDISKQEIISGNLVAKNIYEKLEEYTQALYLFGAQFAHERGLILADTKYEFGMHEEKILLIDEIHTPDSSRYFYLDGYENRQQKDEPQKQLSKEFVREWLIKNNFMGKEGQVVPAMSDEWVETISNRYIELFEKVTGKKFERTPYENAEGRIQTNILNAFPEV